MSQSIKLLNRNLKGLFFLSHASFSSNSKPLDIHVTFPSPQNDGKTPVVLLLGWLGCQDRHLKKYSKIYEDRGLITMRYTAPMDALFFRPSKLRDIGGEILKTLDKHQLDDHPFLVHGFSNGGSYCFRYISALIQATKKPIQIRGQIFDSGPCDARLSAFFNVLVEVIGKDKFYSSILASLGIMSVITLRLLQYPIYAVRYVANPKGWFDYNHYRALKNDRLIFPQMFLYSKEDRLMPYKDVESFASHRKELGVDVSCHCFDGSAHVSHYMTFPKLYTEIIDKFLEECFPERKPSSNSKNI